ncbi:MAG: anthranilate synthase component I [Sandaracinaceae bacterium]
MTPISTPLDFLAKRVSPSREAFLALDACALGGERGAATHVPLRLELAADTETPVSAYHKLSGQRPGSFLLESAHLQLEEPGQGGAPRLGRYSFVGFDVDKAIVSDAGSRDPLETVQRELGRYQVAVPDDAALPPFLGGAVGYLGYDVVRHFERVPLAAPRTKSLPEAQLLVTEELAVFDHALARLTLVVLVPLAGDRQRTFDRALARLAELSARLDGPAPPRRLLPTEPVAPAPATSNVDRASFEASVREAQEAIAAGEIFQVVLSQRFTVERAVDPFALYRALRALNPSPYMFLFRFGTHALVGASPETLVKTTRAQAGAPLEVHVRPIAGTRRRGATPEEDEALGHELAVDPKELAEHRMLLDLGRNDVGRVAALGSVRVERPLHIERYSHVMHLVSDVRGKLAEGLTAFDAFRAAFPAGTVSGAPKIRAMELLARLEPDRRGVYAGAVGYFGFDGQSDTCLAIRTVVVEPERAHVQAGAGIVLDSDPTREHEECVAKARAALVAVAEASAQTTAIRPRAVSATAAPEVSSCTS